MATKAKEKEVSKTTGKSDTKKKEKKAVKLEEGDITGYCMKTKEKGVLMHDVVITKNTRGVYMAQGHDGDGNKMCSAISEATAKAAIAAKKAKKDFK